jgi:hypothetical protein
MSGEAASLHAVETIREDSPQCEDSATFEKSCQTKDPSGTDCIAQKPTTREQGSQTEELQKDLSLPFPEKSATAKNRPTTYIQHRAIFTDGWNSVWHFAFGYLALQYPIFVSMFVVYQFLNIYEVNVFVDILEFLSGHLLACVLTI